MTTQEQLDSLQAAITAIENGAQEYRIGDRITGRLVRKADIAVLYKERRMLQNQIAMENVNYNNRVLVR